MTEKKRRRRRWPWIAVGLVLLSVAAFFLIGYWVSPPNGGRALAEALGMRHPMIIAHRGASYLAPESTRHAHRIAVAVEADYLEGDIQRTRDGHLVVFHDDDLSETTDVKAKYPDRAEAGIGRFTLAELRSLDAGSWFNRAFPDRARKEYAGARILTLDELIDVAEGGDHRPGLYLETKLPDHYPGVEQEIVATLTRRGWLRAGAPVVENGDGARDRVGTGRARIVFQSFEETSLQRLAEVAPGVPRVLLVLADTVGQDGWSAVLERAKKLGHGVGPRGWEAFWWNTGPAHDAGLVVHPYTINSWLEMRLLRQFGVDGFFTDRPALGLETTGRTGAIDTDRLLRSLGYTR